MKRRPVLGAICGLLFGVFLALDLQQFSLRAFDGLTGYGLPVLFAVIGFLLGLLSPLHGLRRDRTPVLAEGVNQSGGGSSAV